jgi:hypothetical protein
MQMPRDENSVKDQVRDSIDQIQYAALVLNQFVLAANALSWSSQRGALVDLINDIPQPESGDKIRAIVYEHNSKLMRDIMLLVQEHWKWADNYGKELESEETEA